MLLIACGRNNRKFLFDYIFADGTAIHLSAAFKNVYEPWLSDGSGDVVILMETVTPYQGAHWQLKIAGIDTSNSTINFRDSETILQWRKQRGRAMNG